MNELNYQISSNEWFRTNVLHLSVLRINPRTLIKQLISSNAAVQALIFPRSTSHSLVRCALSSFEDGNVYRFNL